jgi:hypothetical protein
MAADRRRVMPKNTLKRRLAIGVRGEIRIVWLQKRLKLLMLSTEVLGSRRLIGWVDAVRGLSNFSGANSYSDESGTVNRGRIGRNLPGNLMGLAAIHVALAERTKMLAFSGVFRGGVVETFAAHGISFVPLAVDFLKWPSWLGQTTGDVSRTENGLFCGGGLRGYCLHLKESLLQISDKEDIA